MLCVSNHITVSCKLMFLAWSPLIRMLYSTLSTAPPMLCTGTRLGADSIFLHFDQLLTDIFGTIFLLY